MPKILLIDDHAILRSGARMLIERHVTGAEVLEAGRFDEALVLLEDADIDLAVLDLGLPDSPGEAGLILIRARFPSVPVVVLSGASTDPDALIEKGAHAFVSKNADPFEIVAAVEAALSGEPYRPGAARTHAPTGLTGLSERQRDLVMACAEGLSNKEIGRRLGISDNTVRSHLALLFRRFGVKTRAELAALIHRP